MKNLIRLIVLLSAIVFSVSCSSSSKSTVPFPELIKADLQNVLTERNSDFKINSTETIKSIGEGNDYEFTMRVNASSKYADWIFEYKLKYKLYDQGWIIENIENTSETYNVNKYPDANTLVKIMNNADGDKNVKDENAVVETAEFLDSGLISLVWNEVEELILFEKHFVHTSNFSYDSETDEWNYEYTSDKSEYIPLNVDLNGKWYNKNGYDIEFIDFSWEGFTLSYDDVTEYFFRISNHPEIPEENAYLSWFWYTNGNGIYCRFDADRSEFVLSKGLSIIIRIIDMEAYKSKIKYNGGTYELDDISNKVTAIVTVKADDNIITDMPVRIEADNGFAFAKDAITKALDSKNILYKFKDYAGYEIIDVIGKYDTGSNNEYLWVLYINGEEGKFRFPLCTFENGDRIELIRIKI